jgi:hypothetical protein
MQFRSTPRVIINASAYCEIGLMVSPGFSRQCVGPWKYPWSIGKKSALPSFWISWLKRFFIPQSNVYITAKPLISELNKLLFQV